IAQTHQQALNQPATPIPEVISDSGDLTKALAAFQATQELTPVIAAASSTSDTFSFIESNEATPRAVVQHLADVVTTGDMAGGETQRAYNEFSRSVKSDNRRRTERFRLAMPTRVTGYDKLTGKWDEMTQTINVSRTGVRLRLRHRLRLGNVMHLMLPLPVKLRSHGYYDSTYKVYAIVRRIEPAKGGEQAVGL